LLPDFSIRQQEALPKLATSRVFQDVSEQESVNGLRCLRFTRSSIALRQAEQGTPAGARCRKLGVSEATFYAWTKRYAGRGVAELRRVRQLEDENRWLQQGVADLTLDKQMLQEVRQKSLRPARRACGVVGGHRATFYYRAQRRDPTPRRMRLRELAAARPRFGYRRRFILLRREGGRVNHKRVYRRYSEEHGGGRLHARMESTKHHGRGLPSGSDGQTEILQNGGRS
jgi:putative transposase